MTNNIDNISHEFSLTGCAFRQFPTLLHNGVLLFSSGDTITMMPSYPFNSGWGVSGSICLSDELPEGVPVKLYIIYLSLIEGEYYGAEIDLKDTCLSELYENNVLCNVLIGMGPWGRLAIWIHGNEDKTLINYYKTQQFTHIIDPEKEHIRYLKKTYYTDNNTCITGEYIDRIMRQYVFKFNVAHSITSKADDKNKVVTTLKFDSFDGTNKIVNDCSLAAYSYSGIPERIIVDFVSGKIKYSIVFWLSKDYIINVFECFYGAHPETKTDFIIKIDAENKKYELALYRQGLKEPVVIPESAYQLIVFKNKFEDYRSENYNQPRGAWIW